MAISQTLVLDIVLSISYGCCRLVKPLCEILPPQQCGLDQSSGQSDQEVYTVVLLAAMLRTHRSGSWSNLMPKVFFFLKLANIFLFYRMDVRMLVVYMVFLLIGYLLQGPGEDGGDVNTSSAKGCQVRVYTGKELTEYLSSAADDAIPLLVAFHASWSPPSQALVKLFQEMASSGLYSSCVKFATVEVSHDLVTARSNSGTVTRTDSSWTKPLNQSQNSYAKLALSHSFTALI
ncbi:thioredoxin-related transmembrane protein 2-B-like isoform X2 [Sycon ciliatum]|uniref:thioredoxin-related transmembrane protein 2-B-like isoform X2 n=1 Tax=Sycon ciliatum TaxID=27933 RepID=UPI0031F66B8A